MNASFLATESRSAGCVPSRACGIKPALSLSSLTELRSSANIIFDAEERVGFASDSLLGAQRDTLMRVS